MRKNLIRTVKCFGIAVSVMTAVLTGCGDGKVSVRSAYQNDAAGYETEAENTTDSSETTEQLVTTEEYAYVHLCGAVVNPGVYKMVSGTRVYEAVDMAGGVTEEADTQAVNMARPVEDEMQLYIPTKEEVKNGIVTQHGGTVSQDNEETKEELLNINRATKEELMELPGIGEAKAEAIIAYREEHGIFTEITELMNISGIKEAAFSKIKDKIKV